MDPLVNNTSQTPIELGVKFRLVNVPHLYMPPGAAVIVTAVPVLSSLTDDRCGKSIVLVAMIILLLLQVLPLQVRVPVLVQVRELEELCGQILSPLQ